MPCFRGLLRWRVLVALMKETGVFVRLRLRLRRDARHRRPPPTPATDAHHRRPPPTPARSHDPSRKPRAMPGVVPAFPSKHPRHTAVVFTAKHRRAVFWSAYCATRSDPLLVSSVWGVVCACWIMGFHIPRKRIMGVSSLLRVSTSRNKQETPVFCHSWRRMTQVETGNLNYF